jgi:gliding motility-associated-like protein
MKQVCSCQLISLFVILLFSILPTSYLKAQEGEYTIHIRQPLGDTIFACPDKNLIFVAEGQNADGSAFDANQVNFTWSFGYGNESRNGNTITFKYPEGGHYILQLNATSLNGNAAQNVPVAHVFVSMPPYFSGTRSDESSFCSGEPITLTGFVTPRAWTGDDSPFENSYNLADYVWAGANVVSDRHGVARAEPPLNEGHHNYIFRIKDNFGCFFDTTLLLYGVYAEYTMDPLTGEAPLEVTFSVDSSSNGGFESSINYLYQFYERTKDSSDLLSTDTGVFSFEQPGEYITRMIASYDQCTYRFDLDQFIKVDSSLLEIPNIFTPNEDGANDYFQVKSLSLKTFHGKIFNRWGKLVYEWNDWKTPEAGWNGKNMGTGGDAPSGTYFYVIQATGWDWDNESEDYKAYKDKIYTGSVTLLR